MVHGFIYHRYDSAYMLTSILRNSYITLSITPQAIFHYDIMISSAQLIPTPPPLESLNVEIVQSLCLAYSAYALNIETVMPYTVIYAGKH